MFLTIDAAVLKRIQDLCDKIYEVFGITKYAVAKNLFMLSGAFVALGSIRFFVDTLLVGLVIVWLVLLIILLIGYVSLLDFDEGHYLKNGSITGITERLSGGPFVRFGLLFTSVVLFVTQFDISITLFSELSVHVRLNLWRAVALFGMILLAIANYVMACVPRPPRKSRVRNWWEKSLDKLSEKVEPAPDPHRA